jgi:hypothetical protein
MLAGLDSLKFSLNYAESPLYATKEGKIIREVTTTKSEHTPRLTKTCPFLGPYSGPAQSILVRSLVACITNTAWLSGGTHRAAMTNVHPHFGVKVLPSIQPS